MNRSLLILALLVVLAALLAAFEPDGGRAGSAAQSAVAAGEGPGGDLAVDSPEIHR